MQTGQPGPFDQISQVFPQGVDNSFQYQDQSDSERARLLSYANLLHSQGITDGDDNHPSVDKDGEDGPSSSKLKRFWTWLSHKVTGQSVAMQTHDKFHQQFIVRGTENTIDISGMYYPHSYMGDKLSSRKCMNDELESDESSSLSEEEENRLLCPKPCCSED